MKQIRLFSRDYTPKRPEKSLKFYEPGADLKYLTYLCNVSSSNPWDGYALAYLEAAKFVFKGIQENEPELPNTIGYSFFFLFRHYLELRIKELIKCGCAFYCEPEPNITLREHDLIILWDFCEPLLKRIAEYEVGFVPEEVKDDLDTIRVYLQQIMTYDPKSDAFRYPCDSRGNPHFQQSSVTTLNTFTFAYVMDWMSYYLEGESTRIYQLTEERSEYPSD